MDDKRRDVAVSASSAPSAGGDSPASAEPTSSTRRRAGGQKRKSGSLGSSGSPSSSAPSKRVSREKSSLLLSHSLLPIHNHNGPLTRARQGPTSLGSTPPLPPPQASLAKPLKAPGGEAAAEALRKRNELEALEAAIEAKFESVRSRSDVSHVVPNHCGWFSWTKIHPIEERTMLTFFNGKSELRTSDTYLEIRNWIMRKFHANPSTQIELKDLSELEVADLDSRQEVMEFLDYWGLINFHPFPQSGSAMDSADGDRSALEKVFLTDKLYHFETPQSSKHAIPKNNVATPTVSSGLFPESAIAEELMKLEGPAVEYHCNSCSADCSRKRYHCQKQADFDLCSECFSNKKFNSGMSSSDFILMEPGEFPGLSGGKWTDQETLLLLEALELYKENWTEIAEHVATKTKAQCILHFVQMPIEDGFLDFCDDIDSNSKEIANPVLTEDSSAPKDAAQATEGETDGKENQNMTSSIETSKEETNEEKSSQDTSKPEDINEAKASQETSKPEEENESKDCQEIGESCAMKALKQAFEAVGYPLSPKGSFSFVEVGNPIMALAAFLANYVGADLATASAHNSLKSLSANSPGIELATRHCFILEDPPNDTKELAELHSTVEVANGETQKDTAQEQRSEKEDSSNDNCDKRSKDSTLEEKRPPSAPDGESPQKSLACEESEPKISDKSGTTEIMEDQTPSKARASDDTKSEAEVTQSLVKEMDEKSGEPPEPTKTVMDVEMSEAFSEDSERVGEDPLPPKEEKQKSDTINSVEEKPSENVKDVDMVQQAEKDELSQTVSVNTMVENTAIEVDIKERDNEKRCSTETKEEDKIDKLKRSAVSAISAAAVKAKLLATEEEDQIRKLSTLLIEKQLQKLEYKLTFFSEMENIVMRVREQLEKSRIRLYQERAQIIASRLGTSRMMPSSLPANRITMNVAGQIPRPPLNMASLRPPMPRPPMGTTASNTLIPLSSVGSSIQPPGQENFSSVGTK